MTCPRCNGSMIVSLQGNVCPLCGYGTQPSAPRRRNPYRASATSRAAALANRPRRAGQRERVYDYLTQHASTREEIANALGLKLQSVCARARELLDAGLIAPRGERRTASGSNAEVLAPVVAPAQEALL